MSDTVLVRIKPYDPRRGNLCRSYTVLSMKFLESKGWYEVERELAESTLAPLKQPPSGTTPRELLPALFDIMEPQQAVALEAREEEAKHVRSKALTPNAQPKARRTTLSTTDLTKPSSTPPAKARRRGKSK